MRKIQIGNLNTGPKNNICDVKNVLVGHYTLHNDNNHTGITVILPHNRNLFKEKVMASSFVLNGFGKAIGLVQIEEMGTIETPIVLTNTLNSYIIADGVVSYMLKGNLDIGLTTGTINPVVLECNDSGVNNIRDRVLTQENLFQAIENAKDDFEQGSVGAGSGMTALGYKAGIGSSSRIFKIKDQEYTIGVLVNANFQGNHKESLIINGKKINQEEHNDIPDQGSIIIVVATDMPCDNRILKRLSKRAALALSKTGSYCGNGSGDIILSFTTQNVVKHYPENAIRQIETIEDKYLDKAFIACIEATEEAIINSLLYSKTIIGYDKKTYYSINDKKHTN